MNADSLIVLLPLIAVAGAAIIVMLAIAFRRGAGLGFWLTLAGLAFALASVPASLKLAPLEATGLLRVDAYALFFDTLFMAAAAIVALLCRGYFRGQEREEIYILLLTATLGGMMLASSSHFASFFLGLEILSVSLFPLIAFRIGNKASLEAGIKYLMLSGISSALLLFGMALIYGATGALSFGQLAKTTNFADLIALAGIILMVVGLGFKLSLVPFHLWTPDVYQGAPAPATAFIATVSKTAVFALLVRLWIMAGAYRGIALMEVLGIVAIVSILAGNLLALLQSNLKRMLAYSSIAHMGYALAAFVAGSILQTELLAESVGFYLLAYVITNLGAFGVVSALSDEECESEQLQTYQGLFWREPGLSLILTANMLSLAGIPLTVGFIGKFYVFAAGVQASLWLLVASVAVGSGMGLYYYLRVVITLFGQVADQPKAAIIPPLARPTLAFLALILLATGIFPQTFMQVLQTVAKSLT